MANPSTPVFCLRTAELEEPGKHNQWVAQSQSHWPLPVARRRRVEKSLLRVFSLQHTIEKTQGSPGTAKAKNWRIRFPPSPIRWMEVPNPSDRVRPRGAAAALIPRRRPRGTLPDAMCRAMWEAWVWSMVKQRTMRHPPPFLWVVEKPTLVWIPEQYLGAPSPRQGTSSPIQKIQHPYLGE